MSVFFYSLLQFMVSSEETSLSFPSHPGCQLAEFLG